jgi:hypothetical protein
MRVQVALTMHQQACSHSGRALTAQAGSRAAVLALWALMYRVNQTNPWARGRPNTSTSIYANARFDFVASETRIVFSATASRKSRSHLETVFIVSSPGQ